MLALMNIFLHRQNCKMLWPKKRKNIKNEKIIKRAIFSVTVIISIVICITWLQRDKQFDVLEKTKLSTYSHLSSLIGKIIGGTNADSLANWNSAFNNDFYDGETIPTEDSITLIAMRRFKFELNDKLNGTTNILEPAKFEKTGQDIIQACQLQIAKITTTEELAKNN